MHDLIFCQRDIPKNQWRYGLRSSAAVGCGWIATYNALRLMGYKAEPEALIRYYVRQVPLLHGNTGTLFFGPAVYFRRFGFPVKMIFSRKRYDEAAKNADAAILFYHWREKWRFGAHFVALHHTDKGFIGYNTYRNSTGPDAYGESLEAFIKRRKYYGTVLITISPRSLQ